MNAAVSMQSCPDPETLSAFIDQRLDPKSRLEVVKHLAECGDCRDLVVAANEYSSENETQTGEVVRGRFGRRWVARFATAAAVVAALFGVMPAREMILARHMRELEKAANDLPKRTIDGRLSGNFAYKQAAPTFRGNNETSEGYAELQVGALAGAAAERASKNPSVRNLHTAGVGHVLVKGHEYRQQAVIDLEKAARAKPDSASIQTDLAAVYLARGTEGDYERALSAANKALNIEPTSVAAAWNRALALQKLNRDAEAIAAWNRYLELDPSSPWAQEAKTRLANLQPVQ